MKEEHDKCDEENKKINKEIEEVKLNLEKIRKENRQKSQLEQNNQSLKLKEINHNLTEKQIKEKNQQRIKNSIDKYWQKNRKKIKEKTSNDYNNYFQKSLSYTNINSNTDENINSSNITKYLMIKIILMKKCLTKITLIILDIVCKFRKKEIK